MQKIKFFFSILVLSIVVSSCSSKHNLATQKRQLPSEQFSSDLYLANSTSFNDAKTTDKKIIYTAFIVLTVKNLDTANLHIERIAKKYKGYASNIGTYQTTIRVKSENLNDAIINISNLGKVLRKSKNAQDVTDAYLDYKIKLDNAEKSRKRYLELLVAAENVETILKVEKELERLSEKIDLLKSKMTNINHLSTFSTITIHLKERKKPGFLGYIGVGLYQSVKWLFVRN